MFKLSQTIQVALAGLFVVPALTATGGEPTGLGQTLEQTLTALESLAGIQQQLASESTTNRSELYQTVRAMTEPPIGPDRDRDDRLVTLRDEVSNLQMILDELTLSRPAEFVSGAVESQGATSQPAASTKLTIGLDDSARRLLASIGTETVTSVPSPGPHSRTFTEEEGFTADSLKLGQAYYRAGRYLEAITVLESIENIQAEYWRGRCLERMGQTQDAIAAYRKVMNTPEAGHLIDQAKSDIEFLTWKSEFSQRLGEAKK